MKRSPLLRKTPLARTSSLVTRSKPMRRTRLVSRINPRSPDDGGDKGYLDFIRSLVCCVYGTAAPSHAHHESENGRGKGQKAPDRRTMPMSFRAHREWHDHTGFCAGWTRQERRDFQDREIERCQALFRDWKAFGVLQEPLQQAV